MTDGIRFDSPTERLAYELTQLMNRVPGTLFPRLRFAVTPEEHAEIRRFALERTGQFWSRLLDVPLVVEADPRAPRYCVEFGGADGEAQK